MIPTQKTARLQPLLTRAKGVSLVEILIGVTIGLIGIMMMFQLLENWNIRKRTTSAGGDAQIGGSVAMYRLEQDIRQAGYGFGTTVNDLGCTVNAYSQNHVPQNFTFRLAPVVIQDSGVGGTPDTISVLYGNSDLMSAHYTYQAPQLFSKQLTLNDYGIRRGNLLIVADAAACGMVEVTNNTAANQVINHISGNYTTDGGTPNFPSSFNDPVGYLGGATGRLFNMGNAPSRNIWQIPVNGRVLQARNDLDRGAPAALFDVGEGIINLQAEYGLDTDNDTLVDTWQTADPGAGAWRNVRAIAIAILARSQQYEKDVVTPSSLIPANDRTPRWSVGNGGTFTMKNLDGASGALATNDDKDWRHYRYRVYEAVIPLRNMVWGTAP